MKTREEIMLFFVNQGFQVTPPALTLLESQTESIEDLLGFLRNEYPNLLVIDERVITEFSEFQKNKSAASSSRQSEPDDLTAEPLQDAMVEEPDSMTEEVLEEAGKPIPVTFLRDNTLLDDRRRSPDYRRLFRSRFSQLRDIVAVRLSSSPSSIEEAIQLPDASQVTVIGMVCTRFSLRDQNVLELESPRSPDRLRVIFSSKTSIKGGKEIFLDSVIAVAGQMKTRALQEQGTAKMRYLGGTSVFHPGTLPRSPVVPFEDKTRSIYMAVIGDLHVGSIHFAKDVFESFIHQITTEAESVPGGECPSLIVVLGDLIEGSWGRRHPSEKGNQEFPTIESQYAYLAKALSTLPETTTLIVIPGEHDFTRRALPQPAIDVEHIETLSRLANSRFRENPCWLTLNGRSTALLFHGQGLEKMGRITKTFDSSTDFLIECLEQRHLCLSWGSEMLAPEPIDYLVIDKQPDLFLVGHLHSAAYTYHNGTTLISAGTFCEAPSPVKKLPRSVGVVPFLDLTSLEVEMASFG
jgi:DNA polymerase II small subunit/DNA polymerase delta subunit B